MGEGDGGSPPRPCVIDRDGPGQSPTAAAAAEDAAQGTEQNSNVWSAAGGIFEPDGGQVQAVRNLENHTKL